MVTSQIHSYFTHCSTNPYNRNYSNFYSENLGLNFLVPHFVREKQIEAKTKSIEPKSLKTWPIDQIIRKLVLLFHFLFYHLERDKTDPFTTSFDLINLSGLKTMKFVVFLKYYVLESKGKKLNDFLRNCNVTTKNLISGRNMHLWG